MAAKLTNVFLSIYIYVVIIIIFFKYRFQRAVEGGALIWWVATKSWQVVADEFQWVAVFSKWFGFGAFNERISATLNISGKMKIFSLFK